MDAQLQRARLRGRRLPLPDPAQLQHPVDHDVAAIPGRAGPAHRVVGVRVADHPGQQGGLGQREPGRGLGEEVPGRRLDPVRTAAEVGDVQVPGQDLVLGEPPFHRDRVPQLAQLARGRDLPGAALLLLRTGLGEQQVLHVLLGDARAALGDLAGAEVAGQGAQRALRVQRAVLVEPRVLDGQDGFAGDRGDLVEPHVHPVLVEERGDELAVGRQDPGPLRHARGVQVVRLALEPVGRVTRADTGHAGGGQHDQRDQDPGEDAEPAQPADRFGPLRAGGASALLRAPDAPFGGSLVPRLGQHALSVDVPDPAEQAQ